MEVSQQNEDATQREDEDVTQQEDDTGNGWTEVRNRKRAKKGSQERRGSPSPTRTPRTRGANLISRITRASKMPRLPTGDFKIVIRPRGGLQLSKLSLTELDKAVYEAAEIPYEERETDTICPNNFQNILVVSTPNQDHADKYQGIKHIKANDKLYEVGAYETAPELTAKGVIKGVPLNETPRDITAAIITARNPTAIAAKRLGNTTTVIVLFDGSRVPTHVMYRGVLTRCSLYRKQVDFCKQCNRLGHRSDVCWRPNDKLCAGCGTPDPSEDHHCQPRCQLCGKDHPTADKLCKAKFKTPYIVKQRQWFRQLQETLEENYPPTTKPTERGRSKFRTRATPGSRSRSWSCATPRGHTTQSPGPRRRTTSRSRSRSKPKGGNGHQGNPAFTVSWSDVAKGTRPEPSGETAHNVSDIAELKKENAELRELISQLTREIQSLKNCTNRTSSQMRSAAQERLEEMPDNRMDEDSTPPPLKRKAQVSNDKTTAQTSNINQTLSEIQKAVKEQAEATNNLSLAISMIMNRLDKLEANVANLNPRTPPVLPATNLPISTEGNSHLSQGTTSVAISTNFMRPAFFHPPSSSIANSN